MALSKRGYWGLPQYGNPQYGVKKVLTQLTVQPMFSLGWRTPASTSRTSARRPGHLPQRRQGRGGPRLFWGLPQGFPDVGGENPGVCGSLRSTWSSRHL